MNTHKHIESFVETWESRCYKNGIPDDAPQEIFLKVPSYKLIARAILSNDLSLIGVDKKPCKAYISLKRLEISKRESFKDNQLKLF